MFRRKFIKLCLCTGLCSVTNDAKGQVMDNYFSESSQLYQINGGDGDPSFFGEHRILKSVSANWFDQSIWGQQAYLFEITNGNMDGAFVALTSRWKMSIIEQIEKNGIASVVVHVVQRDDPSPSVNDYVINSVGMSVLEKYIIRA